MPRTREFLTDREMVITRPEEMKKLTPQQKRDIYRDLRNKSKKMIDALTLIAESKLLPEKQLRKIFTSENVGNLVSALTGEKNKMTDRTPWHDQMTREIAIRSIEVCNVRAMHSKLGAILGDVYNRAWLAVNATIPKEK